MDSSIEVKAGPEMIRYYIKSNRDLKLVATIWYCMILHGIILPWCYIVLHGIICYCMVLYVIGWYYVLLHGSALS